MPVNAGAEAAALRAFEYALAVEIDDAGRRAHEPGAEQEVERQVALKVIEEESQQAFGPESRIGRDEALAGIAALAVEKIRDCVTGSEPDASAPYGCRPRLPVTPSQPHRPRASRDVRRRDGRYRRTESCRPGSRIASHS